MYLHYELHKILVERFNFIKIRAQSNSICNPLNPRRPYVEANHLILSTRR